MQFAKRVVGRRMYGGQSTYIPLKVNQAGVIPIIFASSVLYLPADHHQRAAHRWLGRHGAPVRRREPRRRQDRQLRLGLRLRARLAGGRLRLLLHGHRLRPRRQADQIRKQGGFIPGIRPGPQTERYLAKVLSRITLPGALFIAAIAVLPFVLLTAFDVRNFPFAGTTVLIAVGVALETMKQIDSQLMMRNYEGFLK